MKNILLSLSLVSLLSATSAFAEQGGFIDTALSAIGLSATEFSADETKLLEIVQKNTTKPDLVTALVRHYGKDHEWPLQVARYKLPELLSHLTKLNDTDTYTNDIELIQKALELIEIGTVPFN